MGKVIKKNIQGMSTWAKISLVTTLTLLVSVFMYQGWYKPNQVAAAAKTFYITDNTGTSVATGVTTNVSSGVNPTSATPTPDINLLGTVASTTTTNRTTGSYTAGATMLESIYNTAYASATAVTGTSYFGRLRDGGSGGYTVGFQLFYIAANGTRTNFTGAQATQAIGSGASADFTVSLAGQSATVPAGSKLGIRVIYVSGSTTDARVYFGSTASVSSTNGGVVIVNETVADATSPAITTFTVPTTSTSLTISGIVLAASDAVGVTGYLINESATPPAASAVNLATAPTTYTAATAGAKTLYCWARDAAGNVSNVFTGRPCTITLPDTTLPTVTTFTVPTTSASLTISGISFVASDNVGVTGYLINESATAPTAAAITLGTAPTTYTAATAGAKTLYAWVKDAAGNVSLAFTGRPCTITLPDTTLPTVTTFTVPTTSTSLTISGISLVASDNVGVTGYLINESATAPAAATITLATAPTSYTAATAGAKTLYAWVKDAAGNVSLAFTGRPCTITLPDTTLPTVTTFTVPTTSTSLTISGISLIASDNIGVTGYLINESATAPAAAAITQATAPSTYTAATAGAKTLYAWVKDAAGNVSLAFTGRPCTITLPDTTLPTVTTFTVPSTSSSLTVTGISLVASDNVGVTGYLINESNVKPAAASVNIATAPTSYTAATAGAKVLYAWARDAAGNVSNVFAGQPCNITLPDTTLPTVTTFAVPSTSSSLIVSGISLVASDNIAVTGYLINESNVKPAAASVNIATAPTTYTAATAGAKVLYAWARDAAGNVSNVFAGQPCNITLADITAPTVTTFTVPSTSTTLTVSGIVFTASDNIGVTGYLINESATPPLASAITLASAPTTYTAGSTGAKVLFAWVKDAAGNVSPVFAGQPCSISAPSDSVKPTVTAFTVPATSNTLTLSGITFTATDNVAVTGYLINESATPPAASAITSALAPTTYTASSAGAKTLYAWARDAAGNVSNAFAAQTCTIAVSSDLLIHKSSNLGTKYGTWGETFTCQTCHSSTTTNVKRVAEMINTPNGPRSVVFTRMTANRSINTATGVFGNDARTYAINTSNNACSVCHHKTAHHQYSSAKIDANYTKAHYNNRDCISCHLHSAAFAKPAGASHSFPYAGNLHMGAAPAGSYGNCTVCHTAVGTNTYPVASTVAPDCTGCHINAANFNSASAGCADCHGTNTDGLPNGTTFPNIAGSHAVSAHNVVCATCHNGAGSGSATHGNSNAVLKTRADVTVAFTGTGQWNGSVALTCSSTSCHANPTVVGGFVTTPAWGTTGNGCAACHAGANLIAANGPATGSHGIASGGHNVACTSCHAAGTTLTVAPSIGHADGDIDVANVGYLTLNKTKGTAGTTCSAASCHASPVAATLVTTPAWGTTGNGCAACHIGVNAIVANGPATGSHGIASGGHNVACISCHEVGTTQTIAPTVGHIDGNIDVANVGYLTLNKTKGSAGTTCSAASCHASPVAATLVVTPAWGTINNGCAACHTGANAILSYGPATGSHAKHSTAVCTACHAAGTTATAAPSLANGHNDGNIDIVSVGYATLNKTKGTAGVSCSTSACHGSTSPAWGTTGALPNNDMCTTCHGTETVTITAANRTVIAPSDATATDTGKVSANAKTGAHQTHLLFSNALSGFGTQDSRCTDCHGALPTSGSHANGASTPAFQGLATNNGAMAASFSAGNCSNTYCHNPAAAVGGTLDSANAGTGITPSWTNGAYIADGTLKTQTNCNKCHKVPGDAGFTFASAHGSMVTNNLPANNCIGCHGHEGGAGGAVGQQHMDGIRYASGNCDSCHGYQAGSWATAPVINAEGKGAHESHISYLTTKRFGTTIALTPATDQYASTATTWTNVCGICHDNSAGLHNNGTVNVAMNASQAYVFGPAGTVATYNGLPGRLAANDKTCSNISCHYFTTPVWSTY